jgi:hypothetical protein
LFFPRFGKVGTFVLSGLSHWPGRPHDVERKNDEKRLFMVKNVHTCRVVVDDGN